MGGDPSEIQAGNETRNSPWFLVYPAAARQPYQVRLVCFHHAGGGASCFSHWRAWLPSGVECLPIQLPGRENRLHERLFEDAEVATALLVTELTALPSLRTVFFGHSMGGLLAFATAQEMLRRGLKGPERIILSGVAPPGESPELRLSELPRPQLLAELQALEGTSKGVLEDQAWMDILLPTLRADLRMCESYRTGEAPPLAGCTAVAMAGAEDRLADRGALERWQQFFVEPIQVRVLPGGHFYHRQAAPSFREAIVAALAGTGGSYLQRMHR